MTFPLILFPFLIKFYNFLSLSNVINYIAVIKREGDNMKKQQLKRGQYTLSPADLDNLEAAADNIRDLLIIKLAARSGLRRQEIAEARAENLADDFSILLIKGKGKKERSIPLPESTKQTLKFYLVGRRKGFIFASKRIPGGSLSCEQIHRIIAATAATAGIKSPVPGAAGVSPHLLRHSAARSWKSKKVSLETIQNVLGHKYQRTTADIYGLQSLADIKNDMGLCGVL